MANGVEFKGNIAGKQNEQFSTFRKTGEPRRLRAMIVSLALIPGGGAGLSFANRDSSRLSAADIGSTETTTTPTTIFRRAETTTTSTTRPKPKETTVTTKSTPKPSSNTNVGESWTGEASYYSRAGCIGCSPDRTMANGKPLDDNALTVAFNRAALGTHLKITNLDNNKTVEAVVTDTGGFEKYGKIIDLNLGTKNAIGCASVCDVKVALT